MASLSTIIKNGSKLYLSFQNVLNETYQILKIMLYLLR